ncbi:hypothetical protein F2Q68_00006868 [Brassica cretica]|uniref:Wall-associated receptor kinase galacturonan-binding domain-containing protein n=1 Tax=Brassica cretica TaxID=69181 RepID=A0A8S9JLQ0_BRACR|nr:hypothetical protein F2Q68_00006868 [Brassica cretica]
MSSPILFPFSKPNFRLILILFFLFYFHHLPCALSQPDLKSCDQLFHCGNISAGFPFWGEARPKPCGHPSLGLQCDQNSDKTYFTFSGQMYRRLYMDNSTNTLGFARQDFLVGSFCNSTFTGTTLTNELFQLSPEYTTLFVYYLCEPHLPNPANFKCPKIECKSTGGVCGYDVGIPVCCKRNSSSKIKCNQMLPSDAPSSARCTRCVSLRQMYQMRHQRQMYKMHFQVPDAPLTPNVPDAFFNAKCTIALFASYVPSDQMCCSDEPYAL